MTGEVLGADMRDERQEDGRWPVVLYGAVEGSPSTSQLPAGAVPAGSPEPDSRRFSPGAAAYPPRPAPVPTPSIQPGDSARQEEPVSRRTTPTHPRSSGPRVVAFFVNKGGVGKTTCATATTYRADALGLKTLVLSMDRQGDAMKWLSRGDQTLRDGSVFNHSSNVTVLYTPEVFPRLRAGGDLVVVDAPPEVWVPDRVRPDLWVSPIDGRMADRRWALSPRLRPAAPGPVPGEGPVPPALRR